MCVYLFSQVFMLQSVFSKKKQEMAHSFKKNVKIVLWTIEQANQKKKMFTAFWL